MAEHVLLIKCPKCGKTQQTSTRGVKTQGSRNCVYCGKNISLNRFNVIRRVK